MSPRTIALACFFLSGSTGLIYEILWSRFLGSTIGNTHFSITVVVAVFMGGLALGSFVGGRLADRSPNPLRLYGLLILAVGVTCLLVPLAVEAGKPLFAWVYSFYEGEPEAAPILAVRILFCALMLIVPTSFMGATLPVLSRHFTRRLSEVGGTVGTLYAVNTLGALCGAAFAGFVGIHMLGLWGLNLLAVGIDVAIGVVVLKIARGQPLPAEQAPEEITQTQDSGAPPDSGSPLHGCVGLAVAAFAATGFANMLLQLAWTKAIVLTIGNSTYAFTLIVSLFILGIAVGGAVASLFVDRIKNLPLALGLLILAAGALVSTTIPLLGYFPILGARLFDWVGEPDYGKFLLIQILLVSMIILPSTICMGTVFPLVGKIRTRAMTEIGRSIGTAYFWNTFGSILGTLAAGFLFIPLFERVYYTLYLGAAISVVMGLLLVLQAMPRPFAVRLGSASALAALVVLPHFFVLPHGVFGSQSYLWHPSILSQGAYVLSNFKYAYDDADGNLVPAQQFIDQIIENNRVLFYKEGIHAPVAVVTNDSGAVAMRISGKVDASLPPGGGYNNDLPHQIMAGHLPMVLHPAPENVLTLGLGGGVTLGTLTLYPVSSIDSLEISPEVISAARDYFATANRDAIVNDRVRNVVGDGRYHLEYTTDAYDVITSVPSNPWIAGIGNLFTVEFFEICKRRLREDGIICNWIHKINMRDEDYRTVVRTFVEVFDEHAQLWDLGYDSLLIGSKSPLRFDADRLRQLLQNPEITKDLAGLGIHSAPTFLRHYKFDTDAMKRFAKAGTEPHRLNTDLFPVLEYACPFGLYGHTLDAYKALAEAKHVRLDSMVMRSLSEVELAQGRELRTAFHHYLLGFVRELDLEEKVAALRKTKAPLNNVELIKEALQIVADLKAVVHSMARAQGDPWLEERARILAQRALGTSRRYSLAGGLAAWFVKMAQAQPNTQIATAYLKQAAPYADEDPAITLPFCQVALGAGLAPDALNVLERAVARHPEEARLFLALGVVRRTRGDFPGAIEAFEQGFRVVKTPVVRSQLHCDLGRAYQQMRQFDAALTQYEQAVGVHPENKEAHNLLSKLQALVDGAASGQQSP